MGFDPSLREFFNKSLLHHCVLEPNFESWMKLLGSPLAIPNFEIQDRVCLLLDQPM